jgi:hypothetical protein
MIFIHITFCTSWTKVANCPFSRFVEMESTTVVNAPVRALRLGIQTLPIASVD